jgi:enoyl-CoA hydratase/carnithine racemase
VNNPAILLDIVNGIATITISNTRHRNALTIPMWADLAEAVTQADRSARVIVIVGAGDHFSSGIDLHDAVDRLGPDFSITDVTHRAESAIASARHPIIAAIRGYCVGGGVLIASACDLRIAASGSRFAVTPARLGMVYPASSLERLVALIGPGHTKLLLYTAAFLDAEQAGRAGLVEEVVPPEEFAEQLGRRAREIAELSEVTQVATKVIVDGSYPTGSGAELVVDYWQEHLRTSGEQARRVSALLLEISSQS